MFTSAFGVGSTRDDVPLVPRLFIATVLRDIYKDKETRYQRLMNQVIRQGVKTKVLMLSATPVNNRFNDLKNQLALAYEGDSETLSGQLRTSKDIESIFRRAQAAFNAWSVLPAEKRTATAILSALDFDFFELLDSVTIARSRNQVTRELDTLTERREKMAKSLTIQAQALANLYTMQEQSGGTGSLLDLLG